MCHCMGLALDEWGLINGALNWFQSHTGPCIHQNLSYVQLTAPSHTHAKSFSVHLLTQAKTNCSFFWGPFMLRRTFNPLLQHTWGGKHWRLMCMECAADMAGHVPRVERQGSQRECRQTLFSNNLALLHTQAHGHPSCAPLFPAFCFCQVLSRALTALFRKHIMMDCCICICIQKQQTETQYHTLLWSYCYTGSVASQIPTEAGNPKFAGFISQGMTLSRAALTLKSVDPTWLSWMFKV